MVVYCRAVAGGGATPVLQGGGATPVLQGVALPLYCTREDVKNV